MQFYGRAKIRVPCLEVVNWAMAMFCYCIAIWLYYFCQQKLLTRNSTIWLILHFSNGNWGLINLLGYCTLRPTKPATWATKRVGCFSQGIPKQLNFQIFEFIVDLCLKLCALLLVECFQLLHDVDVFYCSESIPNIEHIVCVCVFFFLVHISIATLFSNILLTFSRINKFFLLFWNKC